MPEFLCSLEKLLTFFRYTSLGTVPEDLKANFAEWSSFSPYRLGRCVVVSEHSVIIWDPETVPDLAAAARLLDLGGATSRVREALGPGFPKHPLSARWSLAGTGACA